MRTKHARHKFEKVTEQELAELEDAMISGADIFDLALETEDSKACPRCGGDLDDGDHTYCQKW